MPYTFPVSRDKGPWNHLKTNEIMSVPNASVVGIYMYSSMNVSYL